VLQLVGFSSGSPLVAGRSFCLLLWHTDCWYVGLISQSGGYEGIDILALTYYWLGAAPPTVGSSDSGVPDDAHDGWRALEDYADHRAQRS